MDELPLTVYGSTTCEDTALVAARLRALNIPFALHYAQEDANVNPILEKYNAGMRVTPTLVFGNDDFVLSEPTLEQLEARLGEAGYIFSPPQGIEVRGAQRHARVPNFTLPSTDGSQVTLYKLPRRKRAVLYFVRDTADRAAQGYARQLTNQRELFDDYNALPLPILGADMAAAEAWAHEFARGYPALADPTETVRTKYDALFGLNNPNALLLILDAFCEPRVISCGVDAGELIAPGEVTSWLRLLDHECDE
jgi:peroxiredoxin